MKQPEAKPGSMEGKVRETALRITDIKSITKYESLFVIYNIKINVRFKK